VQDALNEREGKGSIYSPSPSSSQMGSSNSQRSPRAASGISRGAVVRREGWVEWMMNLAIYPLRFILSATNELFQLVGV